MPAGRAVHSLSSTCCQVLTVQWRTEGKPNVAPSLQAHLQWGRQMAVCHHTENYLRVCACVLACVHMCTCVCICVSRYLGRA